MRLLLLTSTLTTSFLSLSLGQFTPFPLFERKALKGCQHSPYGTYIHFTNQSDPLLHYSIYTPWTHFYPDALKVDLFEQGFQPVPQRYRNSSDRCGWKTVDVVKKHGWHRGDVSFRHALHREVKTTEAPAEILKTGPTSLGKPLPSPTRPAVYKQVNLGKQATMAVHLDNRTRQAGPHQGEDSKVKLRPSNDTLSRIHNVLVTNSPQADILFLVVEVTLPILGVVAFLTLVLLVVRHITNKLYPDVEDESHQGDIELSVMREGDSTGSDKTLVDASRRFGPRGFKAEKRFPDSRYGGVFAWRLAMERPKHPQRRPAVDAEAGASIGSSVVESQGARQSSSVYSRSTGGATLCPGRSMGGWGSR